MLKVLAKEPQLLYTLLAALGAALAIPDVWTKVAIAAAALVLGLLVRQTVSSPETVASAVEDAAVQTAQNLTAKTVGAAGDVSEAGSNVVSGVVDNVLNNIGGLVSKVRGSK